MNAGRKNEAIYEIMHKEQVVAVVSRTGRAAILSEAFLPYDLDLEPIGFESCEIAESQSGCLQSGMCVSPDGKEEWSGLTESDKIDMMLGNLDNFYHWCASRILSLDRKYAKEIMNSLGVAQAVTDRDRAEITLSYHCVTLTDVFWVRKQGEKVNLSYDSLDGAGCQTVLPQRMTQREAAIEAVQKIGLRQIRDVDRGVFKDMESEAVMFERRLCELLAVAPY